MPSPRLQHQIGDTVHVLIPIPPTVAQGLPSAHPPTLEVLPSTLWRIDSIIPNLASKTFKYTASPTTNTSLTVNEVQLLPAILHAGDEVLKLREEKAGLGVVYKVEGLRVVWELHADAPPVMEAGRAGRSGGFVVMAQLVDEVGRVMECAAREVRCLTEEERGMGKRFWPVFDPEGMRKGQKKGRGKFEDSKQTSYLSIHYADATAPHCADTDGHHIRL